MVTRVPTVALDLVPLGCPHCRVLPLWPAALRLYAAYDLLVAHLDQAPGITSGYRCPLYNATLPGAAPGSAHLQPAALDLSHVGVDVSALDAAARAAGFGVVRHHRDRGYTHVELV